MKDMAISLKKIVSFLNIDKNSATCGSFDRYYWGWKKKDFQDSTLAYAVQPLLKGEAMKMVSLDMKHILEIVIKNIKNMMHSGGSFDQSYPYEYHPKIGLDFSSVLFEYLKRHNDEKAAKIYRELMEYSLKKEERYGIICNHLCHHMYEYLLAHEYFKDDRYYQKARNNLKIISENTDAEGWHLEYLGADPGYQTRSLRYLTKCIEIFRDEERRLCESLCIRSAEFLERLVMPDGTIFSMFGSRNTALLYPSGIEYMALYYPEKFSPLAMRVRKSIENGSAILPLQLEFDNFLRLCDDFLDAQVHYEKNRDIRDTKREDEEFNLQNFGLKKMKVNDYAIYFHYKFGGIVAVYRNDSLHYKDSGFLLEDFSQNFYGTKNLLNPSRLIAENQEMMVIDSDIFKSVHQELSPLKLIILRLLNLTFLRLPYFADLFRNIVVREIITGAKGKRYGSLKRKLTLEREDLIIEDTFALMFEPKRIFRTVFLHLFHMASSRYLHPVDYKSAWYEDEVPGKEREFTLNKIIKLGN